MIRIIGPETGTWLGEMSVHASVEHISLRTRNIEELEDASVDWDQQYMQMSSGQFQGQIDMVVVGSTQVFREQWGRRLRYCGTTPNDAYAWAIPLGQTAPASWMGRPVGADTLVLQSPGREADLLTADHSEFLGLTVSKAEVHALITSLAGRDYNCGELELHGTLAVTSETAFRLRSLGQAVLFRSKLPAVSQDEIAQYTHQFTKCFVSEILLALDVASVISGPVKSARIVQQATDLIEQDVSSAIGLTDLCTRLGVSLRTLHYAFQDATGIPPSTWLRIVRLNRIHKVLIRSDPNEVLVKQIALKNGFFHLGHFSSQYQKYFGCLPSHTLHSH